MSVKVPTVQVLVSIPQAAERCASCAAELGVEVFAARRVDERSVYYRELGAGAWVATEWGYPPGWTTVHLSRYGEPSTSLYFCPRCKPEVTGARRCPSPWHPPECAGDTPRCVADDDGAAK